MPPEYYGIIIGDKIGGEVTEWFKMPLSKFATRCPNKSF